MSTISQQSCFKKKKMSLVGDKLLALPINKGPNI